MKKIITGVEYKTMLLNATVLIARYKQALNELNVFPVPDGDTGTNMYLTLNFAVPEVSAMESKHLNRVAEKAASLLLRGAHGNSGVITCLLFSGMAKHLKDVESANAVTFAAAMKAGVDRAYSAVNKPAEGTILTVARKAADAARKTALETDDIEIMLQHALEAARIALAKTPEQNPVLAKAGVVDAGGMGYCRILEGFLEAVRGNELKLEAVAEDPTADRNLFAEYASESIEFGYCTEFIVMVDEDAPNKSPAKLRAYLESQGDSVVVVDDGEVIKIHVHTNNPGLALQEGLTYGALTGIKIENMREQHHSKLHIDEDTDVPAPDAAPSFVAPAERQYGFVAVAAGPGVLGVFNDLGVDFTVEGGQTMNPSTEDILRSVNKTPSEVVFVLPNNKNIILSAEQAADLTEKKLIVLPTKSIPEGVAAMLAFDPDASVEENQENMTQAASNVRAGLVTYAARDSFFDEVSIQEGDYLALVGGKLAGTGKDLPALFEELAKTLGVSEASFITVFAGEGSTSEINDLLMETLQRVAGPYAEITLIDGGQPVYYYMIGVE